MWNSLRVHSMSSRHASAGKKEWYSSCEHAVRFLLYNSDVGGPLCWVPTAVSEVCPAFLLICLTTHTCLRAVQKTWGVEGWGGVEDWVRAKRQRLPVTLNKCVWSEIREGKTQIPVEELLWQLFECEGCWTTGVIWLAEVCVLVGVSWQQPASSVQF